MALVTPAVDVIARLASVTLPSCRGGEVELGSLWRSRTLVLVHVRHFGCLYCRHFVSQLRDARDRFAALDAEVVVVGTGDTRLAADFVAARQIPFDILVDETLETYRIVGAGTTQAQRTSLGGYVTATASALLAGERNATSGPHPEQNGALHVIGPGGEVWMAWIDENVYGHASIDRVCETITSRRAVRTTDRDALPVGA